MNQYFNNNENLESNLRLIDYKYENTSLSFYSDLGVFSKDHIDFGSKLLIETYLKNKKNISNILDVGCGYGFLGITLAKVLGAQSDMVDINNRGIHLTEKNIKHNKVNANVYLSNAYENITKKYDLIVTNPPIRAGKKVYYEILLNAKKHLAPGGELWFVIRKNQGAKSIINDMDKEYTITVAEKSKGFYVISAKSN